MNQVVTDKNSIALFCPLPDYPAGTIANMDMTIRTLREPNKYGLALTILSHVATKLNVNMDTNGTIKIPLKDESYVMLYHDAIIEIPTHPYAIVFVFQEQTYKLTTDGDRPKLYKSTTVAFQDNPLWQEIYIK